MTLLLTLMTAEIIKSGWLATGVKYAVELDF